MMHCFTKMHGLGNDFVLFDARDRPLMVDAPLARTIADRHTGIGCDQLIILESSRLADVSMQIFNADGSEVGACGNASRCVPLFLGRDVTIETAGGIIEARMNGSEVRVDMGRPRFEWDEVPLAYAMDTLQLPVSWEMLPPPACVNVGNPHVVFFVDDLEGLPLATLGPMIEHDPIFPARVNVNFAQITGENRLRLIVWERGAGFTRACGTGACATAVTAIRRRMARGPLLVDLPGGTLSIAWTPGETMTMSGPATSVFTGEIDLAQLGA